MPWLHLFLPFLYSLGCFSCMTAYLIFFCMDSHYDKTLKKVARYIAEQNEQVYLPRGLMLTDPIERGLRCIEIAIFNEPTQVQTWFPLLSSLHASFIFFLQFQLPVSGWIPFLELSQWAIHCVYQWIRPAYLSSYFSRLVSYDSIFYLTCFSVGCIRELCILWVMYFFVSVDSITRRLSP